MSDAPEPFALARRGLPLPGITRTTLRGAWLPPAARRPAGPLPEPVTATPAPAAQPESMTEEPWWDEAAEWVPSRLDAPSQAGTAAPGLPPSPIPSAPRGGGEEHRAARADTQRLVPPDLGIRPAVLPRLPEQSTSPARHGPGPVAAREGATAAPAASEDRSRGPASGGPPGGWQRPSPRAAGEPAAAAPDGRPQPAASAGIEGSGTQGVEPVATRGASARAVTEPTPDAPPAAKLAPGTRPVPGLLRRSEPAKPVVRDAPEAGPWTAAPLTEPTSRVDRPSPSAAATHALTQVHPMGAPPLDAHHRGPFAPTDLASLLAPPPRRPPEVQIDRVTVTVQAGPAAASPPVPVMPAAAPTPSTPPTPAYRNPWAGYHIRRD